MKKTLLFLIILLSINGYNQQLAFPCAKGAGAYATGGRGGQVIHVTTLNWSGPGSLKEAITTPGKRTIVFDVSGEIDATSEAQWSVLIQGSQYDSLTIAGQTAPAGGITLRTSWLQFWEVDNIIIRYIRIRNSQTYASGDAAWFFGCSNVIIDHCTFSHGGDECFDMATSQGITRNVTIQNSFFQDSKTGVILGTDTRNEPVPLVDTGDFTFINNIFSNISHRFPNTQGNGQYDIINNVIYNWKNRLVRVTQEGTYNIVNNYYKPSQNGLRLPGWFGNGNISFLQKLQAQPYHNPLIYTAGNIVTGQRDTPLTDDSDMWTYFAGSDPSFPERNQVGSQFFTNKQFPLAGEPFIIKTAHQAYTDALNNAGANATLNPDGSINYYRDTKDSADILMIQNDTYGGSFYDARSSIPYPVVPTNSRSAGYDTDLDGMADVWETNTFGNLSRDGKLDFDNDGYTDLEEFLNEVDNCQNQTTNINQLFNQTIVIYPNPTNKELTITSENAIAKIKIYNSLGALVLLKDKLKSKTQQLNIANLPKGAYSLKAFVGSQVITKQIIKQ